jgi:hypothetical protein
VKCASLIGNNNNQEMRASQTQDTIAKFRDGRVKSFKLLASFSVLLVWFWNFPQLVNPERFLKASVEKNKNNNKNYDCGMPILHWSTLISVMLIHTDKSLS